jgi:hypothetical protein
VLAIKRLWRHKLWLFPVVVLGALAALNVLYQVSLAPPKLESRTFAYATASTQLLVDGPESLLTDLDTSIDPLAERAQIYGRLLGATEVRGSISDRTGLSRDAFVIDGSVAQGQQPNEVERSVQLAGPSIIPTLSYRVADGSPLIAISAEAPTAQEAMRLVEAAASALAGYVGALQAEQGIAPGARIRLTPLARPAGGAVSEDASLPVAVMAFLAVVALGVLAIVAVPAVLRSARRARTVGWSDSAQLAEPAAWKQRHGGVAEEADPPPQTARR